MSKYSSKAQPEADKLRGGYYTPQQIAAAIVEWALAPTLGSYGPVKVLEPSCGDGAILGELRGTNLDVVGVELLEEEARKAAGLGIGQVVNEDFFVWEAKQNPGLKFDAVVGNPPYIRFGNWDVESRERALQLMVRSGLAPSKLTNAWVPFVVASVNRTKPGGRVALVVPAELLQVGYAGQLREFLIRNCSEISIISFKELVFPEVLQEVVLLLLEVGSGPARFRTAEINDAAELHYLQIDGEAVRASLDLDEKWTYYYLQARYVRTLREFLDSGIFRKIGEFAKVNVGVVTGRNAFFCMTKKRAADLGIEKWVIPLVARSAHLEGVSFTGDDLVANEAEDINTRLLAISSETDVWSDDALSAYLHDGELSGVHTGYKTRIRKKWWSVPSISVPDGFMLRQISTIPRIFANDTGATSTDTVHRVFLENSRVTAAQLATAALNTITCALSEVYGRSYGGGILELEPSECVNLFIPDPELVDEVLIGEVDDLLRRSMIDEARRLVDERVLVASLRIPRSTLEDFETISETMQGRRLNRNRSSRVKR
ncbi:class I SAM-dependent methyltransferase [Arcanobacterium phocae]|uniref:Eco57I restriction-modification methylase domain-containing protein n=1 Tax=Arcanobacterium phocae TaxID=131112 RepID=UPI001C0EBF29|nr:class I SAM-dependent methyltransferase [Arcanobacterium phocae]